MSEEASSKALNRPKIINAYYVSQITKRKSRFYFEKTPF